MALTSSEQGRFEGEYLRNGGVRSSSPGSTFHLWTIDLICGPEPQAAVEQAPTWAGTAQLTDRKCRRRRNLEPRLGPFTYTGGISKNTITQQAAADAMHSVEEIHRRGTRPSVGCGWKKL